LCGFPLKWRHEWRDRDRNSAGSRTPSRAVRKRDERVRRIIARLRRDAPWLQAPRYGILLRTYAIQWIRCENLHAANGDALDELGKSHPVNDALARIAGKLSQPSRELGLSPVAEKALHLDAAARASHSIWLALANAKEERAAQVEEVVTPAPAASTPPADTNGTPQCPDSPRPSERPYFRK
jgi:hypothetical protein